MRKRAVVYVDGFNFYYGAVRGGPYKWLDLERYFRLLLPNDDIHAVRYFTALITGRTSPNQELYLRALATRPLVDVILGKFKMKHVRCHVAACTYGGVKFFQVPEEKRTDVNIGVRLLDDAYQNVCDRFIIVSGDSDLVPALSLVKARFPAKELVVYVPTRNPIRGAAVELRAAADKHRDLPLNLLPHAQFPALVPDGGSGSISKPATW